MVDVIVALDLVDHDEHGLVLGDVEGGAITGQADALCCQEVVAGGRKGGGWEGCQLSVTDTSDSHADFQVQKCYGFFVCGIYVT